MIPAPLILFDGFCNFCDASVQFVIDRDPQAIFRFAPLQSDTGVRTLRRYGLDAASLQSVALIEDQRCYLKSDAAIRIVRRLPWPWKLLALGVVLPRGLRDGLYDLIAEHRYRFWGRKEACRLPTPDLRRRFVDEAKPPVGT